MKRYTYELSILAANATIEMVIHINILCGPRHSPSNLLEDRIQRDLKGCVILSRTLVHTVAVAASTTAVAEAAA